MKLLIPMSLTSNFLMNTAFSGPFGYRSLSNNSKTTPCECSVVEVSTSIITSLALLQKDTLLSCHATHSQAWRKGRRKSAWYTLFAHALNRNARNSMATVFVRIVKAQKRTGCLQ